MNPGPQARTGADPHPRHRRAAALGWAVTAVAFVWLAWRQHRFVDRYAVNMMYWDQWDLYHPFFHQQNWWTVFSFQFGPHRQGIGFLVTRVLAGISGWNSRWDAFGISFLLMGAAGLALGLARRMHARPTAVWAAIPLIFFNLRQYEGFVGASNLSHGAMPMFLFMLYLLAWFTGSLAGRMVALSLLTFLLIFTGFGLFVGLLTPLLLLLEAAQAWRAGDRSHAAWNGAAMVATALAWTIFLRGYKFWPAVGGFRFPYEKPHEYFVFAGLMISNYFGLPGRGSWTAAAGLMVAGLLVVLCAGHAWRLVRRGVARNPQSVALFCLSAYALLYSANTAVGRVVLGLDEAPFASRYVTLLIPAALALFLQLAILPSPPWRAALTGLFALLLAVGTTTLRAPDQASVDRYSDGRRAWRAAYLAAHDEAKANAAAHFEVYPGPLGERLEFLERHRLNLFLPGPP